MDSSNKDTRLNNGAMAMRRRKSIATTPIQSEENWLLEFSEFAYLISRSDGSYDFGEFIRNCKHYANIEKCGNERLGKRWCYNARVGLAIFHILSSNWKQIDEAIKWLEKAYEIRAEGDSINNYIEANFINVYLRIRHLLNDYKKTKTYSSYREARICLNNLRKSNPELAKAVDNHVQDLIEGYGGMPLFLYRLENKIKECMSNTVNWLRHDSVPFLFSHKKYIIALVILVIIRYLPPEWQGIVSQYMDTLNKFLMPGK